MQILLADDNPRVRSALRLLLEQEPGLEVAGEVQDVEGLLRRLSTHCFDVILLDWELSATHAVNLLGVIRALCPATRVIALSGRLGARQEALAVEADAFVSKGDSPEGLLAILRAWQEDRAHE